MAAPARNDLSIYDSVAADWWSDETLKQSMALQP